MFFPVAYREDKLVSSVLRVQVFWINMCPNIINNPEDCSVLPIFRGLMLVNLIASRSYTSSSGGACR